MKINLSNELRTTRTMFFVQYLAYYYSQRFFGTFFFKIAVYHSFFCYFFTTFFPLYSHIKGNSTKKKSKFIMVLCRKKYVLTVIHMDTHTPTNATLIQLHIFSYLYASNMQHILQQHVACCQHLLITFHSVVINPYRVSSSFRFACFCIHIEIRAGK